MGTSENNHNGTQVDIILLDLPSKAAPGQLEFDWPHTEETQVKHVSSLPPLSEGEILYVAAATQGVLRSSTMSQWIRCQRSGVIDKYSVINVTHLGSSNMEGEIE